MQMNKYYYNEALHSLKIQKNYSSAEYMENNGAAFIIDNSAHVYRSDMIWYVYLEISNLAPICPRIEDECW